MGILGDEPLGLVVLSIRLTYVVCHILFFVWMIYQHCWNMCLFINNLRGSCMLGHYLIFSALLDSTWTTLPVNSMIGHGGPVNWDAWSPDFDPLDFWLWGHLKTVAFSAPISECHTKYCSNSRECLSGDLNETTSVALCATKSWELCWNAWHPHSVCYKDHTNIPHVQQALVTAHMLTGTFCLI